MAKLEHVNRGMRILVVDDFSTMRRIVRNVLQQLGFTNIVEAEDGRAALHKIQSEKVDFVISDWKMPNMMGIDLLRTLRSMEEFKQLPFLMITAESQKATVMEALEAGVSNYIMKPFTADSLEQKVASIFKGESAPAAS